MQRRGMYAFEQKDRNGRVVVQEAGMFGGVYNNNHAAFPPPPVLPPLLSPILPPVLQPILPPVTLALPAQEPAEPAQEMDLEE